MDRLGPVLLPHPGEIDLHELWLEPDRLPVEREGLPDLHDLRQSWQRVEVDDEFKTRTISRLLQEGLGLGGVVAIQPIETPVPLAVIDSRPQGGILLRVDT